MSSPDIYFDGGRYSHLIIHGDTALSVHSWRTIIRDWRYRVISFVLLHLSGMANRWGKTSMMGEHAIGIQVDRYEEREDENGRWMSPCMHNGDSHLSFLQMLIGTFVILFISLFTGPVPHRYASTRVSIEGDIGGRCTYTRKHRELRCRARSIIVIASSEPSLTDVINVAMQF